MRDPLVGRALTLLHARPGRWKSWLHNRLMALDAGRPFHPFVGYPPIQYLAQWRTQMATKRLVDINVKISAVAHEVGYESEAAFSRAFKKFAGRAPRQ